MHRPMTTLTEADVEHAALGAGGFAPRMAVGPRLGRCSGRRYCRGQCRRRWECRHYQIAGGLGLMRREAKLLLSKAAFVERRSTIPR